MLSKLCPTVCIIHQQQQQWRRQLRWRRLRLQPVQHPTCTLLSRAHSRTQDVGKLAPLRLSAHRRRRELRLTLFGGGAVVVSAMSNARAAPASMTDGRLCPPPRPDTHLPDDAMLLASSSRSHSACCAHTR